MYAARSPVFISLFSSYLVTSLTRSQMNVWHVAVCILTPTMATTSQFLVVPSAV